MNGVVYYEAKGPRVNRQGVWEPHSREGHVGLLTPVPQAFFSNLNPLELFHIVRDLRFGAAESWLVFQRSL